MRALLVGGTGFVATLLARRLWADGHDVTSVARGLRDDVLPRDVERLLVDRCVPGALDRVLAGRSFDVVYDFVAHEANAPRQIFALLPDRRRMKRYVLLSSGAVYAVPVSDPIGEDDPLGPRDAYGRGKLDAERAAAACARASGIPLTIVRPNETLGPRDATGRRFLHLVQRAARGLPLVIPGRLDNRLAWGHVEDLARLLALAARSTRDDVRVYNAAGPEVFPFGKYVASILAALGSNVPVRVLGLTGEQFVRWEGATKLEWHLNCFDDAVIDTTRARDELGWRPELDVATAVRDTVRWVERDRSDLLVEDPPDAERARPYHEMGATVRPERGTREAGPESKGSEGASSVLGDRLEVPTVAAPSFGAAPLDALELALLLPLSREPDPLDRASLLGQAARLARTSGALGRALEPLDRALDAILEAGLAACLERDGVPAFRVTAPGYLAVLEAAASPPPEAVSARPGAWLLRFHALARTAYLEWVARERPAAEVLDPFALGIPFDLPDRTGAAALPEGLVERFGSLEDFARAFHAALDGPAALARWRGALRLERAGLEAESARLARLSATIDRDARALLALEGTRSDLIQEVQVARAPDEPVEVLWVKRAELERRTLVEPRIALLDALIDGVRKLEELLAGASGAPAEKPSLEPPRRGDEAPDFALPGTAGEVRLSSLRGRWVVLYFYPVDDTPGCTLEACRFRDEDAAFRAADAVVLGVSTQDAASHRAFAAKHRVPFELLSDAGGRIARAYGVLDARSGWAERVTFLVDPAGRIERVLRVGKIEDHAAQVLATLRDMKPK